MLHYKFTVITDEEKQWVELGFARLCNGEQAMVDEHLIVLATAHHLNTSTTLGLVDLVLNALSDEAG
jgi:hypothetical protein